MTAAPDGNPENEGTVQETEIGSAEDRYAEIVKVRIQAVSEAVPPLICSACTAEVGLKETKNSHYSTSTERFFDGFNGSTSLNGTTLLDNKGRIGGSADGRTSGVFVRLQGGQVDVTLRAIIDTRLDSLNKPTPTEPPTPPALLDAYYTGAGGAQVQAIAKSGSNPVVGPVQQISLWVDERTNNRRRDFPTPPMEWAEAGNGLRDWMEKKFRDFQADWPLPPFTGNSEIVEGLRRIETLLETNNPTSIFSAEARNDGQPVNGRIERAKITWCLWAVGIRRPADSTSTVYNDQAGLRVDSLRDVFPRVAIHETRHAWQDTLTASAGSTDSETDFMVADPPTSAPTLLDRRFSLTSSDGGNSEFDLFGDGIADWETWGDAGESGNTAGAPLEVDAIRLSSDLIGQPAGCIAANAADTDAFGITIVQAGDELVATVTFRSRMGGGATAQKPYEGATVRFDVVGAGTLKLGERVGRASAESGTVAFAAIFDSITRGRHDRCVSSSV